MLPVFGLLLRFGAVSGIGHWSFRPATFEQWPQKYPIVYPIPSHPIPTSTPTARHDQGCCEKKVVGGEVYLLANNTDHIKMKDCPDGCAYRYSTKTFLLTCHTSQTLCPGKECQWAMTHMTKHTAFKVNIKNNQQLSATPLHPAWVSYPPNQLLLTYP